MSIFTPQQNLIAKHLFSLLMHFQPEERRAAFLILSTLTTLIEDGYQGLSKEPKTGDVDFYGLCYDAVLAASISIRMLKLSGNAPEVTDDSFYFTPRADLVDSEAILAKIETQLKNLPIVSVEKNQ